MHYRLKIIIGLVVVSLGLSTFALLTILHRQGTLTKQQSSAVVKLSLNPSGFTVQGYHRNNCDETTYIYDVVGTYADGFLVLTSANRFKPSGNTVTVNTLTMVFSSDSNTVLVNGVSVDARARGFEESVKRIKVPVANVPVGGDSKFTVTANGSRPNYSTLLPMPNCPAPGSGDNGGGDNGGGGAGGGGGGGGSCEITGPTPGSSNNVCAHKNNDPAQPIVRYHELFYGLTDACGAMTNESCAAHSPVTVPSGCTIDFHGKQANGFCQLNYYCTDTTCSTPPGPTCSTWNSTAVPSGSNCAHPLGNSTGPLGQNYEVFYGPVPPTGTTITCADATEADCAAHSAAAAANFGCDITYGPIVHDGGYCQLNCHIPNSTCSVSPPPMCMYGNVLTACSLCPYGIQTPPTSISSTGICNPAPINACTTTETNSGTKCELGSDGQVYTWSENYKYFKNTCTAGDTVCVQQPSTSGLPVGCGFRGGPYATGSAEYPNYCQVNSECTAVNTCSDGTCPAGSHLDSSGTTPKCVADSSGPNCSAWGPGTDVPPDPVCGPAPDQPNGPSYKYHQIFYGPPDATCPAATADDCAAYAPSVPVDCTVTAGPGTHSGGYCQLNYYCSSEVCSAQ